MVRQRPGSSSGGKAPATIEKLEMPYVQQLLDAYSQREAQEFKDHEAVKDHAEFGVHLAMQRNASSTPMRSRVSTAITQ